MGASAAQDDVSSALEALDLARVRFMAVAGHELRTPVTTLRGLSEELIDATEAERNELVTSGSSRGPGAGST